MAAPLLTRVSMLAAKAETTPGTAESLTAAEAVFNVFDCEVQQDYPYVAREGQGSLSPIAGSRGPKAGRCRFSLHGFGGASTPEWMSTFLPACGLGETTGVFAPESKAPETASAKVKNLTMARYQGPTSGPRKLLAGCMGDLSCSWRAGEPIQWDFDFRGAFAAPTDVAVLTPTYPTTAPLRAVSAALTIAAVTPKVAEIRLNLNNEVTLREDARSTGGVFAAVITGRSITLELLIEASALATYDPFTDFDGATQRAVAFEFGTTGNKLAFAVPKWQISDVQDESRNGLHMWRVTGQCCRSAAAGDDELTITRS